MLDSTFVFLKEQEAELTAIFSKYDVDGDGEMTLDEFMALVSAISPVCSCVSVCMSMYVCMSVCLCLRRRVVLH